MVHSDTIWNDVQVFLSLNCLGNLRKQGRLVVQSGAIWNDVLVVETAEKMLKARTLNSAVCRYLKRWFYFLILWLSIYLRPPTYIMLDCFFAFKSDLIFWLSIQKFTRTY